MRIFTAIASWILWGFALFCIAMAFFIYVFGQHEPISEAQRLTGSNVSAVSVGFTMVVCFLCGVGTFLLRRVLFFEKKQFRIEEGGGVFLWLCLTCFLVCLAFAAAVPGVIMFFLERGAVWAWLSGVLSLLLLLLGVPLLPRIPQPAPRSSAPDQPTPSLP
jgi:hypothetical protein